MFWELFHSQISLSGMLMVLTIFFLWSCPMVAFAFSSMERRIVLKPCFLSILHFSSSVKSEQTFLKMLTNNQKCIEPFILRILTPTVPSNTLFQITSIVKHSYRVPLTINQTASLKQRLRVHRSRICWSLGLHMYTSCRFQMHIFFHSHNNVDDVHSTNLYVTDHWSLGCPNIIYLQTNPWPTDQPRLTDGGTQITPIFLFNLLNDERTCQCFNTRIPNIILTISLATCVWNV